MDSTKQETIHGHTQTADSEVSDLEYDAVLEMLDIFSDGNADAVMAEAAAHIRHAVLAQDDLLLPEARRWLEWQRLPRWKRWLEILTGNICGFPEGWPPQRPDPRPGDSTAVRDR